MLKVDTPSAPLQHVIDLAEAVNEHRIHPTINQMNVLINSLGHLKNNSSPQEHVHYIDVNSMPIQEIASTLIDYQGGWSLRDLPDLTKQG